MVLNLIISLLLLPVIFPKLEYNLNNNIEKNISIKPNDNINPNFDKIDSSGESYELFSNITENITNNITDSLFDLYTNHFQEKYNLSANINYYIKTETYHSPNTYLRLRICNVSKYPFSELKIYECSSDNFSYSSCKIKGTFDDYKINKDKKEFYYTIEIKESYNNYYNYKSSLSSINYLFFEFMPKYSIEYMTAKIEYIEEDYKSDNYYYILIIIICTIIIVTITIILYFEKNRYSLLNLNNPQESPLAPSNQGAYIPQNSTP